MGRALRIAVAGLGTVGSGVVRVLLDRHDDLVRRAGCELQIVGVSARDRLKRRSPSLATLEWINDPRSLATSDTDVVVELIGGEDDVALELVRTVLLAGNKGL